MSVQFYANITIIVGFSSQIFRVTYYFVFMREILQHKNTKNKHLVNIISLYWAQASELQVNPRDDPIVVSEVGS